MCAYLRALLFVSLQTAELVRLRGSIPFHYGQTNATCILVPAYQPAPVVGTAMDEIG